jgi:hypothetical protein
MNRLIPEEQPRVASTRIELPSIRASCRMTGEANLVWSLKGNRNPARFKPTVSGQTTESWAVGQIDAALRRIGTFRKWQTRRSPSNPKDLPGPHRRPRSTCATAFGSFLCSYVQDVTEAI